MKDKRIGQSNTTKPTFDQYQESNVNRVVDLQFKQDSSGKWICNNKSCPKCYFEPKEEEPKKRIPFRCVFGLHDLHKWYESKFAHCRFCGKQIEVEWIL